MNKEKGMTKGQTTIVVGIFIVAIVFMAYPIYHELSKPGPETRRVEGRLVWKDWSSSFFEEKYKLTIRNGSRKHTFTVGKDGVSDESWRTVEQLEVGDRVIVYYHTQKAKKGVVEKVVERVEKG